MADSAGALACPEVVVQPEWIDYNGHMNMAFYSLVFDKSLDHVLARIGLDENYLREGQGSSFTLEVHASGCAARTWSRHRQRWPAAR